MALMEIDVDNRGRASLKSAGIAPGRYRVSRVDDSFKLVPVRSYTDEELLVLNDPQIHERHKTAAKRPERYTAADDLP